jgi:hypothetical protein
MEGPVGKSDADRTIADIRERRPVDDKQEAALRKLFGKMRVTYTPMAFSTELDGKTEWYGYKVLGKDKRSVVIHEIQTMPPLVDEILEMSEFTVIQFDGTDSYWVHDKVGLGREYFKRIQ